MRRITAALKHNQSMLAESEVIAAAYTRPNTGASNPQAKAPAGSYRNATDAKYAPSALARTRAA